MTDAAFIQAIRDEPHDNLPRLVYADYLEDEGHSLRAELIRVQCELSRGVRDRGQELELLARMRELTEVKRSGELVDALLADHGLFHLEADLRWIDMTAARLGPLGQAVRSGSEES